MSTRITNGRLVIVGEPSVAAYPEFLATGAGACAGDLPEGTTADDFTNGSNRISGRRARERAKAVCRPCPHRADCLVWALETRQDGVYGGFTTAEREEYGYGLLSWITEEATEEAISDAA